MDTRTFQQFRELIYRQSGIVLADEKIHLLSNRIQKRLRELKLQEEKQYLAIIESDLSGNELVQLLNAISTNVTYFFREERHFHLLTEYLKAHARASSAPLKIWCAAASSGEEPYTLAMTSHAVFASDPSRVRILATDISTKVLQKAAKGIYSKQDVNKVPADLLQRYFHQVSEHGGYSVSSELREMIVFKRLNLVQFPYPLRGPLDIIFCRNVMIYFDHATRARIIGEFWRLLRPGGLLFVSHSENLLGIEHQFSKFDTSIYQKEGEH